MDIIKEMGSDYKAKVFVTSAYEDTEPISTFLKASELDKYKNYGLAETPEEADVIFFVENARYHADYFFSKLKVHPIVQKFPDKVFMYNPHDLPWLVLPGIYPCISQPLFDSTCIAAASFIECMNPFIKHRPLDSPKYLYSFFGNPHSVLRRRLFKLEHPRGFVKASLEDMFPSKSKKPKDPQIKYAELLAESKFVLCPRGVGASSFRLFEAMQAGRVPVILSDHWVRPKGPQWENFAVFVPESQVEKIPQLLEKEEATWDVKSKLAKQAYDDFFASDAIFDYMVKRLLELKEKKSNFGYSFHLSHFQAFSKYYLRKAVFHKAKRMMKSLVGKINSF